MSVPFTRTLPYVLRERLRGGKGARLSIARVNSIPNPSTVEIDVAGSLVTVPRLVSYTPVVGDAVYLLVGETTILALGAVR